MITLFTEEDIVSFGNYMLSDLRETNIRNNAPAEEVDEILKSVTKADLGHWAHLIMTKTTNNEG